MFHGLLPACSVNALISSILPEHRANCWGCSWDGAPGGGAGLGCPGSLGWALHGQQGMGVSWQEFPVFPAEAQLAAPQESLWFAELRE